MRSLIPTMTLGVYLFLALPPAAAQTEAPAPTVTPANGRSIKLEGLVQFQTASSTVDSTVGWDAELRRMRLQADADAGSGVSGRLQLDFDSNRARVRDAYAEYAFSPHFRLRAGQFKMPFNGIETVSAKRLLVIERGNRIRGVRTPTTSNFLADAHYSARNRGVMAVLTGASDRLTIQAGAWLGSGEAGDDNDAKEVAARVEYSVLPTPEPTSRPLVIGLGGVVNGFFGEPRDTLKVVDSDTVPVRDAVYGRAVEAWVEYGKYAQPGIHLAANLIAGDNPTRLREEGSDVELETFRAVQAWAEFLIASSRAPLSGIGLAFRADRFDPDIDAEDDANWFLTTGINVYFGPNVKAQLNYDVLLPEADEEDEEGSVRIQTQLLF